MISNNYIPRSVLFSDPEKTNVKLSPNGHYLSYLAPHKGVLNLWIAPVQNLAQSKVLTQITSRSIAHHWWAYNDEHILYDQDYRGDEDFRIYRSIQIKYHSNLAKK